jgi:hypothetical protein
MAEMNKIEQTAVEWFVEELNKSIGLTKFVEECDEAYKNEILTIIQQAKEMEANQRQEDTNHGYSQGYDDGAQGKEPMEPEISNPEEQSYQDKMKDKIAKAKLRLK